MKQSVIILFLFATLTSAWGACNNLISIDQLVQDSISLGEYRTANLDPDHFESDRERLEFDHKLQMATLKLYNLRNEIIKCTLGQNQTKCEQTIDKLWQFSQNLGIKYLSGYQNLLKLKLDEVELGHQKFNAKRYCR